MTQWLSKFQMTAKRKRASANGDQLIVPSNSTMMFFSEIQANMWSIWRSASSTSSVGNIRDRLPQSKSHRRVKIAILRSSESLCRIYSIKYLQLVQKHLRSLSKMLRKAKNPKKIPWRGYWSHFLPTRLNSSKTLKKLLLWFPIRWEPRVSTSALFVQPANLESAHISHLNLSEKLSVSYIFHSL